MRPVRKTAVATGPGTKTSPPPLTASRANRNALVLSVRLSPTAPKSTTLTRFHPVLTGSRLGTLSTGASSSEVAAGVIDRCVIKRKKSTESTSNLSRNYLRITSNDRLLVNLHRIHAVGDHAPLAHVAVITKQPVRTGLGTSSNVGLRVHYIATWCIGW